MEQKHADNAEMKGALNRVRQVVSEPKFFTFNGVLAFYVAICILCGLYLFNFYRLPHDTPLERIGVIRMLFGLMFIGLVPRRSPALRAHSMRIGLSSLPRDKKRRLWGRTSQRMHARRGLLGRPPLRF